MSLRDEIAMRTLQTMIHKGTWGETGEDGEHRPYKNMREYAMASYRFADFMLEAREKVK